MKKSLSTLLFPIAILSALSQLALSAPETGFVPNRQPPLVVAHALGQIKIDGYLDDPGWQNAAKAANFTEYTPGDMVKPAVETDVLVTYDEDNFYLGFLCYDDPKTVRASMRDRDEIFNDDYVGILFDTYGDAAWGYEIFVNPLGLQGDLRMVSNGDEDMLFDIVYYSRGRITEKGFQVEVAIPFSSLRFPDQSSQSWKTTFWRNRPRASRERSSWAAIDRDKPCFMCQFRTLTGIENVKPGRNFELLPSIIGFQSAALRNPEDYHSGLNSADPNAEGSLNLRYLIASNLTADFAYNPDFSQVESDAAQIDVNTSFALSYPEKRPFFQEGGDLYSTLISTVYTRSINDPLAALKLTGRLGRTSFGYMAARDEHTPAVLPFEERSAVLGLGRSVTNIFRVKRTLMEDSHVGAIITDRRLDGGGAGTLTGGDISLRFLKNYRIQLQVLASRVSEPDDTLVSSEIEPQTFDEGKRSAAFDGELFWGRAIYAILSRDARLWNFSLIYLEQSPTFRADNGFITRNNQREGSFWTGLFFRPNRKVIKELTPSLSVGRVWNFSGERKDEWVVPALSALLKGQTRVEVNYLYSRETYRGLYFPGIRRTELIVESSFSEPVSLTLELARGKYIARLLETPVLGTGTNIEFAATIKPWQRLIIRPEYEYSELSDPDGGPKIFSGYVLRTRTNLQFTRAWFLRLVVQYDNFDRDLTLEPLLSYKLNPFTIFYLGSTHAYHNLEDRNKLTQTARQFFFKLQYLLRA